MKKRFRRLTAASAAACMTATLLFGAVAGAEESTEAPAGQSVEGIPEVLETPVDSMTVALTSGTFATTPFSKPSPGFGPIAYMIWGRLFYQTSASATLEDGGLQPWIGKSVTKVDDSTYDVELYDYVHDSQGNPITADDVIFSYEMSAKEGEFADFNTLVESVTKIDDYNIEIKMKLVMPGAIEEILGNDQLTIVSKDWYENTSEADRQMNPATTGAYTVSDVVQGSGVTLVRNEDPWQKEPTCTPEVANVEKIYYKVITESSMRAIGLENGELDSAIVAATDLSKFYDEAEGKPLDGWTVCFAPVTMVTGIFCNMDEGESIFADNLELRQAVCSALDGVVIYYAAGLTEVNAEKAFALSAPALGGYDLIEDEDYMPYDLDAAREHFEASGVPEGTEITLLSSQSLYTDAARSVIIAQLESIGFTVNSLAVDQALFNTYKNDSTQWDLMLDMRGSGTGHVTGLWDGMFNPANYTNGSMCFTHDDKLVELLETSKQDPSQENLQAFNDYVSDNAICKALFVKSTIYLEQGGITDLPIGFLQPIYGASSFSEDYQSAAGK